jgi:hypothetical protein
MHKITDQFMINAESKDPMTKTTWHPPAALWILLMLVISTRDNMSLSPTGQLIYPAESMDRDGYPKGVILRQQYYRTSNVTNSPSQGFYTLSKATNELHDALGSGRHVSRRGLFDRLIDAYPPMELAIPQDPPKVAMAAATTPTPRPCKENSDPHYPAHNAKAEPDYLKFMKDIKSELGALHTASVKMEALLNRKRKPKDCKDKQAKAHAAIAHGKNHKAQKGTTASSVTQLLPSSYVNSSGMEMSGKVCFANNALACDHYSNVSHAAPIPGPFHRSVAQLARPKQSLRDYFGLSAQRLSNKKRGETSMAATTTALSATLRQPPYVELTKELDINARALADLEEPCIPGEVMVSTMPLELLLAGAGTINAAPSGIPDDELPELVSTSSDEDDEDRLRALPSLAAAGFKLYTAPSDNIRTRRMAFMASFHYPDAIVCSGMDADGSVAVTKTTTTSYEHALEDVSDPHTSSRASRRGWQLWKEEWHDDYGLEAVATLRSHEPEQRLARRIASSTSPPLLQHGDLHGSLASRHAGRVGGRSSRGRRRRRAHNPRLRQGHVTRDTLCMTQPQQKGEPRCRVSGRSFD